MEELNQIQQPVSGSATLADLCAATGGRQAACGFAALADPSTSPVGPIESDSRRIEPGDVFWALRGPNHEGEEFLGEAFRRGASGAVVSKDVALNFSPLAVVEKPGTVAGEDSGFGVEGSEFRVQGGCSNPQSPIPNPCDSGPHPSPLPKGEGTDSRHHWIVRVDDTHGP